MVKKIIIALIALIAIITFVKVMPFVKGDPTKVIIAQPLIGGGDLYCIEGGGWHWKGLSTTYSYTLVNDFYFNSDTITVNGQMWDGDNTDEDDIHVRFAKKAEGWVRGHIQYELPTECEKLIKLHRDKHSDAGVKHNLVRNKVIDAVTNAALLFNASDVIETKKVDYRDMIKTYLNVGQYKTYTEIVYDKLGEDEIDTAGKIIKKADVQKYEVMKLKLDSMDNPILNTKSDLIEYGISVKTPEIVSIKLDSLSNDRIKAIRDKEMTNITNAAAAETAKQTALTAEAEGRAKVAKEKADQEVVKIKAITLAEKEKEEARIAAEKEYIVAQFEAKTAIENAKKVKAEGEAKAAANRALVNAGLTPIEKANIEKETKIGVAEALAKSEHPLVPTIMMGGDGKNGSSALDAVGLKYLMDIADRMSK